MHCFDERSLLLLEIDLSVLTNFHDDCFLHDFLTQTVLTKPKIKGALYLIIPDVISRLFRCRQAMAVAKVILVVAR